MNKRGYKWRARRTRVRAIGGDMLLSHQGSKGRRAVAFGCEVVFVPLVSATEPLPYCVCITLRRRGPLQKALPGYGAVLTNLGTILAKTIERDLDGYCLPAGTAPASCIWPGVRKLTLGAGGVVFGQAAAMSTATGRAECAVPRHALVAVMANASIVCVGMYVPSPSSSRKVYRILSSFVRLLGQMAQFPASGRQLFSEGTEELTEWPRAQEKQQEEVGPKLRVEHGSERGKGDPPLLRKPPGVTRSERTRLTHRPRPQRKVVYPRAWRSGRPLRLLETVIDFVKTWIPVSHRAQFQQTRLDAVMLAYPINYPHAEKMLGWALQHAPDPPTALRLENGHYVVGPLLPGEGRLREFLDLRSLLWAVAKPIYYRNEVATYCRATPHPNLARVIDLYRIDDSPPILVLERVKGPTFSTYLAWESYLIWDALSMVGRYISMAPIIHEYFNGYLNHMLGLIIGMLDGLAHLHSLGIVHRDMHDDNVLVRLHDNVRATAVNIDFDTAVVVDRAKFLTDYQLPQSLPPWCVPGLVDPDDLIPETSMKIPYHNIRVPWEPRRLPRDVQSRPFTHPSPLAPMAADVFAVGKMLLEVTILPIGEHLVRPNRPFWFDLMKKRLLPSPLIQLVSQMVQENPDAIPSAADVSRRLKQLLPIAISIECVKKYAYHQRSGRDLEDPTFAGKWVGITASVQKTNRRPYPAVLKTPIGRDLFKLM